MDEKYVYCWPTEENGNAEKKSESRITQQLLNGPIGGLKRKDTKRALAESGPVKFNFPTNYGF